MDQQKSQRENSLNSQLETYNPNSEYGLKDELSKEDYIDYLKTNYVNPGHPIAYSGINNVYNYFNGKLTIDEIRSVLYGVESYTLHREFHDETRNPSYSHFKRYRFEMDLVDVRNLSQYNDGINYLLTCIDTHTRYAFVRLLPSKHGNIVLDAFRSILEEALEKPKILLVDRGAEFRSADFQAFCRDNQILFTPSDTNIHAPFVERFNRTLQKLVYSYLTENETNRYISKRDASGQEIPLMPLFVKTYNNRKHRMIGVTPQQAETQPELHIDIQKRLNAYHEKIQKKEPNFKVGELVRIAKIKGKFSRGYNEQASQEIFKIAKIKTNLKIPLYILSNYRGDEIIKGSFYPFELVKTKGDVFRIEKVLKKRKKKGKNQIFVKWKGFDDSYNSWENVTSVKSSFQNK